MGSVGTYIWDKYNKIMTIVIFKLPCFILMAFLVQILFCNEEMNNCGQSIKIYKDLICNHDFGGVQSHVQVYCNASLIQDLHENNYSMQKEERLRLTSVNLIAYPVLFVQSLRYRAHLCIEAFYEDLTNVDLILLIFSTREGNDFIRKSAVVHREMTANGDANEKYGRIGCYWHYILLLATSEITVHLDVAFLRKNGSANYGKYYFRIPYWERYNNEKDVDPCLFPPFVYAEESENSKTEVISVGSGNCSQSSFVNIEQRKESSGELLQTEIIQTDALGRGSSQMEYTETLHYYEAFFREKVWEKITEDHTDEEYSSDNIIIISVLMVIFFIILSGLWYSKVSKISSRSRQKPRIRFIYCTNRKYQLYQEMATTLMLFMEEYCDVIVSSHSIDAQDTSETSLLSKKIDVIILIPFPPIEGNRCIFRSIKQWERMKNDCIIMELPIWSRNNMELEEFCKSFTKWKRFTLMDEFLPMLMYIQRCRSCFQRQFFYSINSDETQKKLEENNLTNDGFSFCLKEAFGSSLNNEEFTRCPEVLPNLQEMEI